MIEWNLPFTRITFLYRIVFFVVVSLGLEVTENPESVGKEYEAIS